MRRLNGWSVLTPWLTALLTTSTSDSDLGGPHNVEGLRNGLAVFGQELEVGLNRRPHVLRHFFDTVPRGDTAVEVENEGAVVMFATFDDDRVLPRRDLLSNCACLLMLARVFG